MESIDKKAKSVKACETCKRPFGLTRIRHTCKRCNKIICADCTKGRIKIVTYDLKNAHKVCIACEKEHGFQVKFAASNQTSWNKLSKIGAKWFETCNPKSVLAKSEDGSEETYKGLLEIANNPETSNPHFNAINTDISQGKADREKTNYSLQDFLYSNQGPTKPDQIRTSISNILKAFAVKFPTIGYQQGMINACVFLMSMMDEESAFWSFGYLVTKILPNGFYGQTSASGASLSGCQQEKFVLANLIKETLGLAPELMGKINGLLDMSTPAMLFTLLINCTNFEVSFEAWNKMFLTKSFNEIRKVVIQVFKSFMPRIKESGAMNIIEFKLMVIGLFSSEEVKEAQSLKISDEQIKDLETKFHAEFEGSAANAGEIYDAIVELTKFNKIQIISLQQEFNKLAMGRLRRPSMVKPNQSMAPESHGINRDEFKKVITEVMGRNEESKQLLDVLNLDQIYDAFDINKTGSLDFEELLFVLSMMMQGKFEEKMETAFYVFDEQERGHLSNDEFEQFVFVLTQVMTRANQNNMPASFNDDLEKFSEQMTKLPSDQDKVDFGQFYQSLVHSNFVKYCADLSKSSQPEPGPDFAKPHLNPKEVMTDTSVAYNNQTIMESTQDASHNFHNRDLTRIFDQSTVQEVEGSKFEEDQSQIEDLLTEEQKEKILGLEHEGTDSQNYLGSKTSVPEQKDATPIAAEETKPVVEEKAEIKLESKAKVDSDSDNEEAMMALMKKWKNSPKKPATQEPKTMSEAVNNEGLALSPTKVEVETFFENFLAPMEALEKADTKADLFFDFEKIDACLAAQPIVESNKTIPSCFSSNFLAPLEAIDKADTKADLFFDFEKIDACLIAQSIVEANKAIPSCFSSDFLAPMRALEKADTKADLFFDFEKIDVCLAAQSIVESNKTIPLCFSSNFLAPLSHAEQDFQPIAFEESIFEKTCAALETPQSVVSPQLTIKKMTISEGCQPLALDMASKPIEFSFDFETKEVAVNAVEIVERNMTIKKPFLENSCKAISAEHHQPQEDKSNGLWNLEKVEQGDQIVEPVEPVLPSKAVLKPNFGFGPCKEISCDSLPQALSHSNDIFAKTDISLPALTQPISRVTAVPKPFMGSNKSAQPLEPSPVLSEKASLAISKEDLFTNVNEASEPREVVLRCAVIEKPFATNDSGLAPCQPESSDRSRPSLNWKEACFEIVDAKPVCVEPVLSGQTIKSSFDAQPCDVLLPHRRVSGAPSLSWKENVFSLMDKPAAQSEVCERDMALNEPFADNMCGPLVLDAETPSLVNWNHQMFENVDKNVALNQTQVLTLQAIPKPFVGGELLPLLQSSEYNNELWAASELKLFGSINAFSVAHNVASGCLQVPKIERIILEACAQPLIADDDDERIIALEESVRDESVQEKVEAQEAVTVSKNVEKIEMPLYDNYLSPVTPDEPEKSSDFNGPFERYEVSYPSIQDSVYKQFGVAKIEQPKFVVVETTYVETEPAVRRYEESKFGGVEEEKSVAGTVVLDQSGSTKSYRSTVDYQEREREFAVEETEVIEEVELKTGHHEIGKRLADMERSKAEAQAEEPAGRTSLKTNTENVSGKQYIIDEGDDEVEDENNTTFVNMSVINDDTTSPGIITEISESNSSPQLTHKRKVDAKKDSEKEHKGDSCKTCNVF